MTKIFFMNRLLSRLRRILGIDYGVPGERVEPS